MFTKIRFLEALFAFMYLLTLGESCFKKCIPDNRILLCQHNDTLPVDSAIILEIPKIVLSSYEMKIFDNSLVPIVRLCLKFNQNSQNSLKKTLEIDYKTLSTISSKEKRRILWKWMNSSSNDNDIRVIIRWAEDIISVSLPSLYGKTISIPTMKHMNISCRGINGLGVCNYVKIYNLRARRLAQFPRQSCKNGYYQLENGCKKCPEHSTSTEGENLKIEDCICEDGYSMRHNLCECTSEGDCSSVVNKHIKFIIIAAILLIILIVLAVIIFCKRRTSSEEDIDGKSMYYVLMKKNRPARHKQPYADTQNRQPENQSAYSSSIPGEPAVTRRSVVTFKEEVDKIDLNNSATSSDDSDDIDTRAVMVESDSSDSDEESKSSKFYKTGELIVIHAYKHKYTLTTHTYTLRIHIRIQYTHAYTQHTPFTKLRFCS